MGAFAFDGGLQTGETAVHITLASSAVRISLSKDCRA